MALLSFFGNKKEDAVLLLDIGNGTIGASVALFSTNKKPTFVVATRTSFPVLENLDSTRLLTSVKPVLDTCLRDILKKCHVAESLKNRRITRALVSLSSPWFMLRTKHLHLVQDVPFIITNTFLDDIVLKEEKSFEEELGKHGLDSNKPSFEIIEKNIVDTKINGYTLEAIVGKKTKMFDAFMCLSVVDKKFMDTVHSQILRHFQIHQERVLTHTFPLISFTVLRDLFDTIPDFLMMDITGEVTDLTLVQNNIIIQTASFPSGRNFLLRQIAKKFDASLEIAESTLHLYTERKLDDAMMSQMDSVIIDVEREWSIYFENALLELSSTGAVPATLYVTLDDDVSEVYKHFLELPKTDATASFRKNAKIIRIEKSLLVKHCTVPPTIPADEFMQLVAIFCNKIL